jgi:hypothetical protein
MFEIAETKRALIVLAREITGQCSTSSPMTYADASQRLAEVEQYQRRDSIAGSLTGIADGPELGLCDILGKLWHAWSTIEATRSARRRSLPNLALSQNTFKETPS